MRPISAKIECASASTARPGAKQGFPMNSSACSPLSFLSCCVALLAFAGRPAMAQQGPAAAPTGAPADQPSRWRRPPRRPPPMSIRRPGAGGRRGQRRLLHRLHVPARRLGGEGGDDAAAAGLALVLDHHLQQMDRAGRPQAQGGAIRETVLVGPVAGRALSAIRRPQRSSPGGDVHRGAARMAPRLRKRHAHAKARSRASRSASTRR